LRVLCWWIRFSIGTALDELPSRSAVLPAEIEVLELRVLATLLEGGKREDGSGRKRGKEARSECRYLAVSGHRLGLWRHNRVILVHRGGLLATCLSAIVMVAEPEKVRKTCETSGKGISRWK
jgi:hypothetical protein